MIIRHNPVLQSLMGLQSVTSIDKSILIKQNNGLLNLEGLNSLTYLGGTLNISDNPVLKSISQLENINGDLQDGVVVSNNDSLTSLNGLNDITSIESYLTIKDNHALVDLSGLENISSIGDIFTIENNSNLTSLSGLENISSIGSLFIIDNVSLNDISSLYNVSSEISLQLEITGNQSLTSLNGIDQLNLNSIYYLAVIDNELLSECHVFSICQFMDIHPDYAFFNENATGCNSPEEVQAACDTVSVEEIYLANDFTISPNPCSGYVNLQYAISDQGFVICDIYEISGVRVKQIINEIKMPGTHELKVDLSDIPAGIYFCTIKSNSGQAVQIRKLIIL